MVVTSSSVGKIAGLRAGLTTMPETTKPSVPRRIGRLGMRFLAAERAPNVPLPKVSAGVGC